MKTATITQSRGTCSIACRVTLNIGAPAATIWSLLIDANGFPRWNFLESTRALGSDGQPVSDARRTLDWRLAYAGFPSTEM